MTFSEDLHLRLLIHRLRIGWKIAALVAVSSITVFIVAGCVETATAGEISEAAKSAEGAIDVMAKKDLVWMALAAAIASSLANMVLVGLLFKLTFAGVKAIDRMATKPCQMNENPWRK